MSDDEIRDLLNIEAAARGAQTVSDEAYQRMLCHARHALRPLCEEVLRLRADLAQFEIDRVALVRSRQAVMDCLSSQRDEARADLARRDQKDSDAACSMQMRRRHNSEGI